MKGLSVLFLILCIVFFLMLGISIIVYIIAFYSPNGKQNDDYNLPPMSDELRVMSMKLVRELNERPFERVTIRSYDGKTLAGRLYKGVENAPVHIGFHGYRGTPSRDISGGADLYLSLGHNLLLIEERAHKSSEGHTITFGIRERQDCLSWIRFVNAHFGENTPVMINGISMGAATVLMASELELPGNVCGIIADAPYSSPEKIIASVVGTLRLPLKPAMFFLKLSARLFGGFTLNGASAEEAVKHTKVPILIIHGEADDFVPCEMSRAIYNSNPKMIEFHTFPGAGHGLSFLVDRPRYEAIAKAFILRCLGPQQAEESEI